MLQLRQNYIWDSGKLGKPKDFSNLMSGLLALSLWDFSFFHGV